MQLAAAEAGEAVEVPALDPLSAAALRWREAVRRGNGATDELNAMIALAPSLQTIVLLSDSALQVGENTTLDTTLRRELGLSVLPRSSNSISSP